MNDDADKKVTNKLIAISDKQTVELDGLLKWVQEQKEKAQKEKKPWGLFFSVVAASIVFFALAAMSFGMWRRGKEVAKLKHKVDVDEEGKKQLFVEMEVAKEADKQVRLQREYKTINNRIEVTKLQIEELSQERKNLKDKVDAVTTWEEFDNL